MEGEVVLVRIMSESKSLISINTLLSLVKIFDT
jgi:hypothetical protein